MAQERVAVGQSRRRSSHASTPGWSDREGASAVAVGSVILATALHWRRRMRNVAALSMLMAMTVAAAGCHTGPCGGCAEYETCNVATNACVLNDGAQIG